MSLSLKRFLFAAVAISMGAAAFIAIPASAQEPEFAPDATIEQAVDGRRHAKPHFRPELREKIAEWKAENPDATKEDVKAWLEANKPTEEEIEARLEAKLAEIQETHPDVTLEDLKAKVEARKEHQAERREQVQERIEQIQEENPDLSREEIREQLQERRASADRPDRSEKRGVFNWFKDRLPRLFGRG